MANASLVVKSYVEIRRAVDQGFSGPVLCIPFGADDTTPCRFFESLMQITEEDVHSLLELAHPAQGGRQLHVISAPPRFNPGSVFYQDYT